MKVKVKSKKGFISIDMIVVYSIIMLLGISIIGLYVSKGQVMAGDSSQKFDKSSVVLNDIPLSADGSFPVDGNFSPDMCMGPEIGDEDYARSTDSDVVREKRIGQNTYFFMKDGSVMATGKNDLGQTGSGEISEWEDNPVVVEGLDWHDFKDIYGFGETRVLKLKSGEGMAWGMVPVEIKETGFYKEPTIVDDLKDVPIDEMYGCQDFNKEPLK